MISIQFFAQAPIVRKNFPAAGGVKRFVRDVRYVALLLPFLAVCPAWAEEKIVNIYAWADYFDPAVLDDFTKETGIKIAYDTYDTSAALDTRLAPGHSGYDLVVLSGPMLQKEAGAGLLQKLDKTKLAGAKALWPEIMARLAVYDPGNQYAVNYMWFTVGLTYNAAVVQNRGGENLLASWDAIFKPDLLKRFADCGVEVQDSPNELFALALRAMGLDPMRAKSLVELKRASDLLYGLRRNVKKFRTVADLSNLVGGDACLTAGWSSDAVQARKQAADANSGVTIGFTIPRSGTLVLLDNLAIPKDAPNADATYALINYLLRPEIAARNTKMTHFANGVLASKALLPKEISSDPAIYPDDAVMKNLFLLPGYSAAEQAFIAREWMRVKEGDVKAAIAKDDKKTAKDEKPSIRKSGKAQSRAGLDRR